HMSKHPHSPWETAGDVFVRADHGLGIAECGIQSEDALMVLTRSFRIPESREPGFLNQSGVGGLHAAGDSARVQRLEIARIFFQLVICQLERPSLQFLNVLL